MKFGQFRDQVPSIGQKVYLKPMEGAKPEMFASAIHTVMRQFGLEQVKRRDPLVWRMKYEIPQRSWSNLKGQLVDQASMKIERVE